jgi:hypothetical protein
MFTKSFKISKKEMRLSDVAQTPICPP